MILVTGANGFLGSALLESLLAQGFIARGIIRSSHVSNLYYSVPNYLAVDALSPVLREAEMIIHTAAIAHVSNISNNSNIYDEVNFQLTKMLAEESVRQGVRRFIYISSIKVNGETTSPGSSFTHDDRPDPQDRYAESKFKAEMALQEIALREDIEVIIIRSPIIYGPGVKGNLLRLLYWLDKGLPLPFGRVTHNKRSMLSLDNMIDFVIKCAGRNELNKEVFVVSDNHDVSTEKLLYTLAGHLDHNRSRLWRIYPELLNTTLKMFGKEAYRQRLLCSMQINPDYAMQKLQWQPPQSWESGIQEMVEWYMAHARS